jgi:hypothetical protein
MNSVGIFLLYLLISVALTAAVGTGLARSGRAFLLDVFGGNDALARAVSRLIVLGFYLLSLGFVTLTVHTGGDVSSAGAGLQLLSVKIGEVLLVLGALHLLTIAALVRARRLAQARIAPQFYRPDRPAVGPSPAGGPDGQPPAAARRDAEPAPLPERVLQ